MENNDAACSASHYTVKKVQLYIQENKGTITVRIFNFFFHVVSLQKYEA
jgi:hypothetical protein